VKVWWSILLAVAMPLVGCQSRHPQGWSDLLESSDDLRVHQGRVIPTPRKISDPSPYTQTIDWARTQVESDPTCINRLVTYIFPEDVRAVEPVVFRYVYAGTTQEPVRLVLKYFGSFRDPHLWAGYSCQFVVDPDSRDLIGVWVEKIPLE
jgi:hypothetical protein